jgi:hypothetical protein
MKYFRLLLLVLFLTGLAPVQSSANDGYLAVHGNYGRLEGEGDKDFHPTIGGWIMGGDDEWRAGAGGFKLMSPYSSSGYGNIDLWYAGPMIFWIPNPGSDNPVIHLGAHFGGGYSKASSESGSKFIWFIEPTAMFAFKISSWSGIGISASYRYISNFSSLASSVDTISHSFNAGAALILGEF